MVLDKIVKGAWTSWEMGGGKQVSMFTRNGGFSETWQQFYRVRVFQGQAEKGSGVCPEPKNPWASGLWRWGGAIKHHVGIQVGTVQCGIRVFKKCSGLGCVPGILNPGLGDL